MKIVAILVFVVLVLPAAAQSFGSRDNPVPIGTSVNMPMPSFGLYTNTDNIWQITVLNVIPNATNETVYGTKPVLKFERDPEKEFFLAKIQAKYIGPGSSHFDSGDLNAVGSASVGYTAFGSQGDGIIQDYISSFQEVFTGGVIKGVVAWEIPPADADHLVMYDRKIGINSRTYMALF